LLYLVRLLLSASCTSIGFKIKSLVHDTTTCVVTSVNSVSRYVHIAAPFLRDVAYFETDHTMTKTGIHNIINSGKSYIDITTVCNPCTFYINYDVYVSTVYTWSSKLGFLRFSVWWCVIPLKIFLPLL
jgi:hypothetical protein